MNLTFNSARALISQGESFRFSVKATKDGSNLRGLDWLSFKLSGILGTYVKVSLTNEGGGRQIVWVNKNSLCKRALHHACGISETATATAAKVAIMTKFNTFISTPTQEKLTELVDTTYEAALRFQYVNEDGSVRRPADLEGAILAGVHAGDVIKVRFLLSLGIPLSQDCMNRAVWVAGLTRGVCCLDLLRCLFSNGRTASQNVIDRLFLILAAINAVEQIEILLSEGRTLSPQVRGQALLEASRGGYIGVLRVLIGLGPIDPLFLNEILRVAALTAPNEAQVLQSMRREGGVAEAPAPVLAPDAYWLTLDEVATNPRVYLDHIYREGLPRRIQLIDNPASIDAGGLTKQFLTTLMQALKSKEVIALSSSGLPIIREDRSEENKRELEKMGKLYALIDQKNQDRTDKIVLGNLFHPQFFNFVKIALREDTLENKLKDTARFVKEIDPVYELVANLIMDPSEANKAAYCAAMGLDEVGEEEMNDAKKTIQGYLEAAEAFSRGVTPGFKCKILAADSEALMTSLQGAPISSERLIASLRLESAGPGFLQKVEWIKEKIRSSSPEWMKQFVKSITGQQTLSLGLSIRLRESVINGFEIHTCFNSLDVPAAEMTKEEFFAALDVSVLGDGYNVA